MGCIGMSRDDFDRCTPSQFYEVYRHWAERRRDEERSAWERTRVAALFAIQPHTRQQLTAHEVMPFPWDDGAAQREQLTAEETLERFEAARKRYGLD